MEVMVTSGAIRRAKLQSNYHHPQTKTHLFTGWMPFLSPNEPCQIKASITDVSLEIFQLVFSSYICLIHATVACTYVCCA